MEEPPPRTSRPILLVGMPGSGKSTVGVLLAARLGLPVFDIDAMIAARLGMTIAQIFARRGEERFRAEEKSLVAALIEGEPAIIDAGGGAFLDPETRTFSGTHAMAVWLDVDLVTLSARLSDTADRPLLADRSHLARLKAARDPVYALAPFRVDATLAPALVADAIAAALAEPVR